MRELVTCQCCERHVDLNADACPFCGDALEPTRVESRRGRLSRAALFGVAILSPACGSSEPVERPAYVEPSDQGGEVVASDPQPDAGPPAPPDFQPPPPNMPYGAPPARTRLA